MLDYSTEINADVKVSVSTKLEGLYPGNAMH